MNSQTCKNCKFWGTDYDGVCDKINYDLNGPKFFRIDASADDDSNLQARLVTGSDFGCVQFQNKSN